MTARFAVAAFAVALGSGTLAAQALQRINPPGLSAPTTYAHIVRAGKTLYIAGQVGADAAGKVVGPGMVEQLEQVAEFESGASGGTRTPNPQIRSLMLYPIELRAQGRVI